MMETEPYVLNVDEVDKFLTSQEKKEMDEFLRSEVFNTSIQGTEMDQLLVSATSNTESTVKMDTNIRQDQSNQVCLLNI